MGHGQSDRRFGEQFTKRDLARINNSELLLAAKWWISNLIIMPTIDPWRSHMMTLPMAALLAPTAADLESWLRHAHQAVTKSVVLLSPYETARQELLSHSPPWFKLLDSSYPQLETHDARWSVSRRIDAMGELLDAVHADQATIESLKIGFLGAV